MRLRNTICITSAALALFTATEARAGEPGADGEASVSLSTDDGANADAKASKSSKADADTKWIHRYAPEKMMGEVGIYGGLFLPASNLELFEAELGLPDQGFKPFKPIAPDIGIRAAFFPIKWVGAEIEGGVMPMSLDDGSGGNALGWTARGHVIAQLAKWSVTPFALVGVGAIGVASDREEVGNDVDFGLHLGVGAKIFVNQYLALRFDFRDILGFKQGTTDELGSNNFEILLGLSYTFGRKPKEEPAPPADTDGDGVLDPDDQCVDVPGDPPTGCPPAEPEDSDGDGIMDPDDACPEEPGVPEYDGCPIPDTDGDGILDPDDKCVEEPETKNDYEDSDGCPDEIPEAVKAFTGVIEGIYFDTNSDNIRKKSEKILNKALKVLQDYPNVRLEIDGHTDSRGSVEHNKDLSERRAASVAKWFEDHGIDPGRFETKGYGPDQPIDTNDTKAGRAKNRRIEFKLIQ